MNTKKKAPCTAATGKGAKVIHTTEKDSRNWDDGQEVFSRTTFRLFCDVRKKYIDDWNQLYDERNNECSFFKILAVAYVGMSKSQRRMALHTEPGRFSERGGVT